MAEREISRRTIEPNIDLVSYATEERDDDFTRDGVTHYVERAGAKLVRLQIPFDEATKMLVTLSP